MNDFKTEYATHENLLQSYRLIAISSQSFMLAIGAFLSRDHFYVFLLSAITALIMIWYIWVRIVIVRHRIVDYYKFGSELTPEQLAELRGLCKKAVKYAKEKRTRKKVNKLFASALDVKNFTNWRTTRRKLDCYLPILFTLVWTALLAEQILQDYKAKVKMLIAFNVFSYYALGFMFLGLLALIIGLAPSRGRVAAWGIGFLLLGILLQCLGYLM